VPTSRSQARPVRFALLDLSADGGAGGEQARVEFVSNSYASKDAARRAKLNGQPAWAHALPT
jgi:hypothetical protein